MMTRTYESDQVKTIHSKGATMTGPKFNHAYPTP